jgi:hypothetical protein
MVQKFWREQPYISLLGIGKTKFHEGIKAGLISEPDGYLGPRSPFWTNDTVERDQARILAQPKPIETRPKRRRITKQDKGATHNASPA